MTTKRKIKLKRPAIILIKTFSIILVILLLLLIFYNHEMNQLKVLGYSTYSSRKILFSFKKNDVISVGNSKTLNAAYESDDFNEKYFNNYAKIEYQNQKHLIKNINSLIKKKYNNKEISIILAHGSDGDVTEFAKRDKVRYLEEFFSYDFAKLSNYDRYVNFSDESGEDEETTIVYVNLDLDKEQYVDPVTINSFDSKALVTKHRQLTSKFVPDKLIKVPEKYSGEDKVKGESQAVLSFEKMADDANSQGMGIVINSGYRSFESQKKLCEEYLKLYGEEYVNKYVAKEGFSEHQTGMSFDIGSTSSNVFANSKEYSWVQENAHNYGFIQRFPKGYEDITGFRAESWHYRYVGKKIATYIYEHKITFDEYYIKFLDNNI